MVGHFLGVPTGADAEQEPPAGNLVDRGHQLRGLDHVALRHQADPGAEPQPLGHHRRGGQRDERVHCLGVFARQLAAGRKGRSPRQRDMRMLWRPQRFEPALLQRHRECRRADRIVGEEKCRAEIHGVSPSFPVGPVGITIARRAGKREGSSRAARAPGRGQAGTLLMPIPVMQNPTGIFRQQPQLGFPHSTRSGCQSLRMVLPVRQGLRRRRSVAGISKNPPLPMLAWALAPMRGLGARDSGGASTVGRADVRRPADRCWHKLVTHAVLTVRSANAPKIIAEKMQRTAESRGGRVPPGLRMRRRHAASAALSGPPHLLRDKLRRIAGKSVPPR